jgi:hypothetical protein
VDATEGFGGAQIEQALVEVLYEAEEKACDFNPFMFLSNIRNVVPLARTMKENFDLMRKWYRSRARPASNEAREKKGRCRICPISQP